MRYKCVGFPICIRSFENGHVLRAHQLSCEHASMKLNANIQREQHAQSIKYGYPMNGRKGEKRYITYAGLDNTQKFLIRDRYQLGGNGTNQGSYQRIRQPSHLENITIQTKSTAMDFSGYYT
ncbi:hypothetical protein I4U23_003315 [Adineta vaga]|nr:hypothetical protein I4U23_003315 [Adineta vaga]